MEYKQIIFWHEKFFSWERIPKALLYALSPFFLLLLALTEPCQGSLRFFVLFAALLHAFFPSMKQIGAVVALTLFSFFLIAFLPVYDAIHLSFLCALILSATLSFLITMEEKNIVEVKMEREQKAVLESDLWKQRFESQQKKFDFERAAIKEELAQLQSAQVEQREQLRFATEVKQALYSDLASSEKMREEYALFVKNAQETQFFMQQEHQKEVEESKAFREKSGIQNQALIRERNRLAVQYFQAKLLLKQRMALPAQSHSIAKSLFQAPRKRI